MSATDTSTGLERWLAPLLQSLPALAVFDAHTHLGADCDGTVCEPAFLASRLDQLGARAATFALHVEHGDYRRDNDAVIDAAAASGGRLVPFCRLNPHADPVGEGSRAIIAGARGIKLHPRSESFTLDQPAVEGIFALAHEHALPVLIHAGQGIEPLGAHVLRLAAAYPGATVILAHAAITDLAWIADELDSHPNLVFDTAWWNPADLLALFALVPPGRIVFGSDTPFGDPALNVLQTLRCARQVGLDALQIRSVMGGQLERILAGEAFADLGPAPGPETLKRHVLLDRVLIYLAAAWGNVMAGGTAQEPLELARMALAVHGSHREAEICAAAYEALDMPPGSSLQGLAGLAIAATLVATPEVEVP